MPRVLPSLLILAALLADAGGGHGVALACYGDALEERCSLARPALAGLAAA